MIILLYDNLSIVPDETYFQETFNRKKLPKPVLKVVSCENYVI